MTKAETLDKIREAGVVTLRLRRHADAHRRTAAGRGDAARRERQVEGTG